MESEWFQSVNGKYVVFKYFFDYYSLKWSNPDVGSSGARIRVINEIGREAIRPKNEKGSN